MRKIKKVQLSLGDNHLHAAPSFILMGAGHDPTGPCVWVAEDPAPPEDAEFHDLLLKVFKDGDTIPDELPQNDYWGSVIDPFTQKLAYHVFLVRKY